MRKTGLAALKTSHPSILILGTFPSPISRKHQEYYANPSNRFWRLLSAAFNTDDLTAGSYDEKKKLLETQEIALWDMVESCEIIDAADNHIKNPVWNDIPAFLSDHSSIKQIILNGSTAHRMFLKIFKDRTDSVTSCGCLSTSAANQKYGAWPLLMENWLPRLRG